MIARAHSDEGATATEYVLLLAGVAVAIILSIFAFGSFLSSTYVDTCNTLSSGMSDPAACR